MEPQAAAVRVPPSPWLPSPRLPCPPSPSAQTELAWFQGPPPASPSPPSVGPAALRLPNCVRLSWSLPYWGHPLSSHPTSVFPLVSPSSPSFRLLSLLQSQLSRCWLSGWGVGARWLLGALFPSSQGDPPCGCTLTQDGVLHPAGKLQPALGLEGRTGAPEPHNSPFQTIRDRSLQEKSPLPCDPACPSLLCPETAISIPGGLLSLHVSPWAASG